MASARTDLDILVHCSWFPTVAHKYNTVLLIHISALSSCFSTLLSPFRLFQVLFGYAERFFCYAKHFSSILSDFRVCQAFSAMLSTFRLYKAFFFYIERFFLLCQAFFGYSEPLSAPPSIFSTLPSIFLIWRVFFRCAESSSALLCILLLRCMILSRDHVSEGQVVNAAPRASSLRSLLNREPTYAFRKEPRKSIKSAVEGKLKLMLWTDETDVGICPVCHIACR